jgi:2'-5' RNA ligase
MTQDGAMTQSVEIVLDEATDAEVRAQWELLRAAGLPSQARHTGTSNRPHITLVAQDSIDEASEPAMAAACAVLPLPVRLGALMCFGRGRFVLVRAVVADVALLRLHKRVQALAGEPSPHMQPGAWVPHVTLAHRMSADQVASAITLLTGIPGRRGSQGTGETTQGYAVSARRWDGTARREWPLLY